METAEAAKNRKPRTGGRLVGMVFCRSTVLARKATIIPISRVKHGLAAFTSMTFEAPVPMVKEKRKGPPDEIS